MKKKATLDDQRRPGKKKKQKQREKKTKKTKCGGVGQRVK